MRSCLRWAWFGFLVAVGLASAAPARAADDPRQWAYVVTFGPGDHPFFKFGHNAIWIETAPGEGPVYNFGTFAFDSPALIPKFLRGRMTYWLSRSSIEETIFSYRAENRTIILQQLDLSPEQTRQLADNLRENALPQNREYLYDYFWDNCSTRVRDAVDRVVAGRVHAAAAEPATSTFRQQALRLTADYTPEFLGLYFLLGSLTDQPIDVWREAFLPERLHDLLTTVRLPDSTGPDPTRSKPLVRSERVVFRARRPPALTTAPNITGIFTLVGLLMGGLAWMLGRGAATHRGARLLLGLGTAGLGLISGLLGWVLLLMWMFTNHRVAYANANILQTVPLSLPLVVWGCQGARGNPLAARRAFHLAMTVAGFSLLGLVLRLALPFPQDNAPFIGLFLPLWLGLTLGWRRATAGFAPAQALPRGNP